MKSVLTWFLVATNAILLTSLVGKFTHADVAKAQMAPVRRVSDYLMTPVLQANGQAGIVCIVDENTGQMAAVSYNGRNAMVPMPPVDLERPAAPGANTNGYNPYNGRRY